MSVIFLTHHDESIYDVTKIDEDIDKTKAAAEDRKSGLDHKALRLRQNARRLPERTRTKKPTGVMGFAHMPKPDPQKFLKKNTWKPPMLPPEVVDPDYGHHHCLKHCKLPCVPLKDEVIPEQDKKLQHQRKDFITKNVKYVVQMVPKEPEQKVVLNKYGEATPLKAGLEPYYIYNKVYGHIPRYLERLNKVREKVFQAKKDREGKFQPKCRYITHDVRDKLLAGLKQNWEELQSQYQGLPILTDTIPKIQRKSKMEADLKQLEKDIVTIERHPYIYVYQDDDTT